jgi:hypothetical protein
MASRWFVHLAVGCFVACTSSEDDHPVATRACDPLSVEAPPISLRSVYVAGRAANGTIYVLDGNPAGGFRGFISEGALLRRHIVNGWGGGDGYVVATIDLDLQVRVDLDGSAPKRMGIFRGQPDPMTKSFDIDTQGEALTFLAASDLDGFTVANIASGYEAVVYAATAADGHHFLLFQPTVDSGPNDMTVFYGLADRVAQRKLLGVVTDSTIHLDFDLDGVRTTAQLNFGPFVPSGFGPTRLQPAGGATIPLTRVTGSSADLVAGLDFLCF